MPQTSKTTDRFSSSIEVINFWGADPEGKLGFLEDLSEFERDSRRAGTKLGY